MYGTVAPKKTYNTHAYIHKHTYSCTLVLQGVELPSAEGVSTAREVDSLKQEIQDKDEEIKRLTTLLKAMEEMAGGEGEGGSSYMEWEVSDMRATLEDAVDRRMRAEEELKNLQSRLTERENQEKKWDLLKVLYNVLLYSLWSY